MKLLFRFRRWCHGIWSLLHEEGHRAVDYHDLQGKLLELSCTCGRVFWENED